MYSDLLSAGPWQRRGGHRSEDLLLADLVDSRVRLRMDGRRAPVAEALARELSYDGALIRLCESLEVRAHPGVVRSPLRERDRLEQEWTARGIALSAERRARSNRCAPEPPAPHRERGPRAVN